MAQPDEEAIVLGCSLHSAYHYLAALLAGTDVLQSAAVPGPCPVSRVLCSTLSHNKG